MKKVLLLTISVCFCEVVAQGQFKMNSNGKMLLGPPYSGQDLGNVLSGSIFGPNAPWQGGSKLAFGDFGQYTYNGWNVFIGEYGNPNGADDKLWLHGKWGISLTTGGKADFLLAYCVSSTTSATDFYFNTDVWAKGVKLVSDIRFKHNVQNIEQPLSKLLSLHGVTYDFDDQIKQELLKERHYATTGIPEGGEGEEDPDKIEPVLPEINNKRIGFIAQELQEVFPDLVSTDDLGFLGVDYIGLIPVIVEAMKEQQRQIQALQEQISAMGGYKSTPAPIEGTGNNEENSYLYQNVPNPFTEKTEIKYFLPEDSRNTQLYIFNMQGQNVKTVNISGRGNGSIFIQGAELAPGTYIYTLYSNGKELDSKRMILTK